MKDEEKNLIENLFHRLKNTELNSSERDRSADDLIQNLVKKQPASSYYMTQTILIQEAAIKKMSVQIEELKNQIKILSTEQLKKKPSFLSNFFKKNSSSQDAHQNNSIKKDSILQPSYSNSTISPIAQTSPVAQTSPIVNSSRSSGFLSNALQTATGVAGGMILGNMLMNVFNHTKPEEEIFDTVHNSFPDDYSEEKFFNHNADNHLINHEYHESDFNNYEYDSENIHDNIDYTDEIDMNDDNLI